MVYFITPEQALSNDVVDKLVAALLEPVSKHYGPEDHESGTPQTAHGRGGRTHMGPMPRLWDVGERGARRKAWGDRSLASISDEDKAAIVRGYWSGQARDVDVDRYWDQLLNSEDRTKPQDIAIAGVYGIRSALLKHSTMRRIQSRLPNEVIDRLSPMFGDYRQSYEKWVAEGKNIGWFPYDGEVHISDSPSGFLGRAVDINNIDQLVRNDTISALISQWAITSNDENATSLAIQEAVRIEFNLESAAPWDNVSNPDLHSEVPWLMVEHGEDLRTVARAIYEDTQKTLRETNTPSVPLIRGFDSDEPMEWSDGWPEGDDSKYGHAAFSLRPLSSFSTSDETADSFGEYVIAANVPPARIFSMPGYGQGAYEENEFVVLSSGSDEVWWTQESGAWFEVPGAEE